MRTQTHTLRSATSAIAAALALGSTPLLAQAVSPAGEPVIVPPAPAAAPVIVPQVAPPTTTTAPVVQDLPSTYVPAKAAAPTEPEAAPSTAPAPRAAAPARTPAARAAPVAAAPVTASATNDAAPPAPVESPVSTTADLYPASEMAQDNQPVITPEPAAAAVDDLTLVAGIVGGLALLGFAWFGWRLRRRRMAMERVLAPQVTRPVATPPVVAQREEPIVHTPVMPDAREEALPPSVATGTVDSIVTPRFDEQVPAVARAETSFGAGHARWAEDHRPAAARPSVKGALASNGASVDLPARMPDDYEERDALLKRMIEAKPDKANPYTDRKARMKRARLIIQSLGRDFADADPWIDLSQYPNNWPALARRRYPQAA